MPHQWVLVIFSALCLLVSFKDFMEDINPVGQILFSNISYYRYDILFAEQ